MTPYNINEGIPQKKFSQVNLVFGAATTCLCFCGSCAWFLLFFSQSGSRLVHSSILFQIVISTISSSQTHYKVTGKCGGGTQSTCDKKKMLHAAWHVSRHKLYITWSLIGTDQCIQPIFCCWQYVAFIQTTKDSLLGSDSFWYSIGVKLMLATFKQVNLCHWH